MAWWEEGKEVVYFGDCERKEFEWEEPPREVLVAVAGAVEFAVATAVVAVVVEEEYRPWKGECVIWKRG